MTIHKNLRLIWTITFLIISMPLLFSCGGGGGSYGGGGGPGVNGTISGTAVKGPVSGAAVTAYAINSTGTMGSQIGSGTTDAQGNFSVSIGAYSGSAMLQLSGGSYSDEATASTMTMFSSDVMKSVIPSVASGSTMTGIQITPLTSMAQARAQNMTGGMTAANISAANTAMGNYFSVSNILLTQPMDPLTTGSGTGADQNSRNYGMTIAAISQEAKDLVMPHSSGMITVMMKDASDGIMNGLMGGAAISMNGMGGGSMMMGNMQSNAGTSGLASAMTSFITNTTVNKSGLTTTDMQTLITKLNGSTGTIQ